MIAIQKQGYSDIEGQEVNYDFMEKTLEGLRTPEHEEVNGKLCIKITEYFHIMICLMYLLLHQLIIEERCFIWH